MVRHLGYCTHLRYMTLIGATEKLPLLLCLRHTHTHTIVCDSKPTNRQTNKQTTTSVSVVNNNNVRKSTMTMTTIAAQNCTKIEMNVHYFTQRILCI